MTDFTLGDRVTIGDGGPAGIVVRLWDNGTCGVELPGRDGWAVTSTANLRCIPAIHPAVAAKLRRFFQGSES